MGATCQARSTLMTLLVSVVAGLSVMSNISQGSVATHIRCGVVASLLTVLLQIFSWFRKCKSFENRLLFDRVIGIQKHCAIFGSLWHFNELNFSNHFPDHHAYFTFLQHLTLNQTFTTTNNYLRHARKKVAKNLAARGNETHEHWICDCGCRS